MRLRLSVILPVGALTSCLIACSSHGTAKSSSTGGSASTHATSTSASTNGSQATATSSSASGGATTDFMAGGNRPTNVHLPPSYDPSKPAPLLILLHGYTASGAIQEAYLKLQPVTDQHGIVYAHPDGTLDQGGNRFWDATDACCDLYATGVDDSGYLIGLINEIKSKVNIDPKRVFIMGHSNGGFMSYRMACDHAADIAAIVSLAGATWADMSKCAPTEAVSVLEIHGDADQTINYNGGTIGTHTYPSVATTLSTWVGYDGCSTTADTSQPNLDLDASLPGAESSVSIWGQGCKPGGYVEHWRIAGGSHIPNISSSFSELAVQFLLAHPKP